MSWALTGASQSLKEKVFANLSDDRVHQCRAALDDKSAGLDEVVAARRLLEEAVCSRSKEQA